MAKREDPMLSWLSDEERRAYDEYEKKLRETRDKAVKRHKAELAFWKKVDEREDEVYMHIIEKREKRLAEQETQPGQPEQQEQRAFHLPIQDHTADIRQALLGNQQQ